MNNPFRLAFPRRGWTKISWHPDERGVPTPVQRRAFEALARIPGCAFDGCVVKAPHTAYMTPQWLDALDAVELREDFEALQPRGVIVDERVQPLYPWQAEASRKARRGYGLLLADEMGLGKTRAAIAAVAAYRWQHGLDYSKRPNLIVAPSFTRDVWWRELREVLGLPARDFCALRGADIRNGSYQPGARWYFVHFAIVEEWASLINQRMNPVTTIVDEVHYCKNGRTKRAKGTQVAVSRAELRLALTGTPMDNRPAELWMPLQLVTGAHTWGSPIDFRKRYAGAVKNRYGWQDGEPTNIEELRARMAPYWLRRTLADIDHDLPPLRRQRIEVHTCSADLAKHRDLTRGYDLSELVAAIVEGRAGQDAFRVLHALRQVTSELKLPATAQHIASLLDEGQSVVCFAWSRRMARRIAQRVSKLAGLGSDFVYVVHGGFTQSVRDAAVASFQRNGGLLVATYGALKEGVTLTRARAVVLHDLGWVTSDILQAEKRVHRLGQKGGCMSYWAVAERSIDEIFARLLVLKAEWIERTLGIEAPAEAVDAVRLVDIAPQFSASDWAAEQISKWRDRGTR